MPLDTNAARSRRAILVGGVGGLAALAAHALERPVPVRAADGQVITVGGMFGGTQTTHLTVQDEIRDAFRGQANGTGTGVGGLSNLGTGVWGESRDGKGVVGTSDSSHGVSGTSGNSTGVHGESTVGNGIHGLTGAPTGSGVYGENVGGGFGVAGRSDGARAATLGDNTAGGPGVLGESRDGVGVQGLGNGVEGFGVGVEGKSDYGRGGRFKGKKAQIRLIPSPQQTHPASGSPGDLFVDGTNRLWFCKGGATWKQLA